MDFKSLIVLPIVAIVLVSCTQGPLQDIDAEGVIGNPLQSISGLYKANGEEKNQIMIFDETVKKIHQFDLDTMALKRSIAVKNPEEKHFLIYDDNGNYVIDISLKHLSIFDQQGGAVHNPFKLQGQPKSAAYRSDLGLLVVYDSLKSVGVLKLSPEGKIESKFPGGPVVSGNETIVAGDLIDDGNLVLALSDNSIVTVDIANSILQQQWVLARPTFSSALTGIAWIAPIKGLAEMVLVKSDGKLSLFDTATQTIQDSMDSSTFGWVEKYSKSADAHLIFKQVVQDAYGSEYSADLTLAYVDVSSATIKTRKLSKQTDRIMSSNLDLMKNSWSTLTSKKSYFYGQFNEINEVKESRLYTNYRFSDGLALNSKPAPNRAQIQLSPNFLFALFPSELGYAVRYDLNTDEERAIKMFNINSF